MKEIIGPGDALILVDVQNDFLTGGNLAVKDGDAILAPLNRAIFLFQEKKLPIFATRDWHPENHCSFKTRGGPWPPHCVQHTKGASFAYDLNLPCSAKIISKAVSPGREAYSDFDQTSLHLLLQSLKANRLFVGGLATDYCIKATVLDALKLHYEVFVLIDAVRAVNVQPDDGDKALATMNAQGAHLISSEQLSL